MARLPRIYIQGCSYHLVQRGNNQEPRFYTEQDYANHLSYLKESAEAYGVAIHAYVLMTDDVQLLITPIGNGDASRMMQHYRECHSCALLNLVPFYSAP